MQTAREELCPHSLDGDAVLLENKQIAQEFLPLSIQGCTEDMTVKSLSETLS